MTSYQTLKLERVGPVGWLINARPEALNAMNAAMREELGAAWLELDRDPAVRVIVHTGEGRAFQTGADVKEVATDGAGMQRYEADLLTFDMHFSAWHQNVSKPVIAAINGICAGGGLHFVADADIVIAASDATFFDPHVSVGQGTAIEVIGLARKMPFEAVMRMALVGAHERMPAQRAYELGMVSQVVDPPEELRAEAQRLAETIARNSPAALRATKKALWGALELGLTDACRLGAQHLMGVWGHPDQEEGPRAFVEKREPRWQTQHDRAWGHSVSPGVSATIAAELSAAAAGCPDDVAIYHDAERRTFGELRRDVWQAAQGLVARGVRPGDRVALWAPNTQDAAVALLAVAVAGGVVVPLNTRYRRHEMTEILRRARCRMVIAPGTFLGRAYAAEALEVAGAAAVVALGGPTPAGAKPWPEVLAGATAADRRELEARIAAQSGDDAVVVQYTSGTTGQPKGAVLRQGPMLATSATWAEAVGMRRGDVYPVTYPLAHTGGYKTGLLTTLAARATALLFPVVTTEALVAAISAHPATIVNGPPPVLRSLLAAVRDGLLPASTRIRTVVTGSAIVPPPLIRELSRVLGVADVINAYGLTEATGVCMMTRRGDPIELVCETVGTAIDGVQVRVARQSAGTGQVGEIEVRGPNVMVGYLDDPAATAEAMDDGWLRTGDIGWIGGDGYVRIVGRAKDMVVVGGFNVYPAEVEHVLADHPAVSEAAVVGVPDERLGEVVVAFVVPSAAAPAPDELVRWCRDRLANFKVPRRVWIVESLPRAAVGKVAKPELRERAIASLGVAG